VSSDQSSFGDCSEHPAEPYRRTPPRIWGFTKPSALVATEFKQKLELTQDVAEAAELVLRELGFTPTKADIADVVEALRGSESAAAQAETFHSWYRESVFGNTLLAEGWLQFKDNLREKRNHILSNTLEIPRERWGFNDDEWGGIVPETGLMRQHLSSLTKHHLASIWNSRDDVKEKPVTLSSSTNAEPEPVCEQLKPQAVRLDSRESVDEATLRAVSEALAAGMAKQYMSTLLPAAFGEESRKNWVQDASSGQSMSASLAQLLTYRFTEYYAYTLSEETEQARRSREEDAAAREAAATAWMEDWRRNGSKAGKPPDDVNPSEAAKVVLKTAIKQEVARFMELQLVPLVQTQLREHLIPATLQTVKSMAWEFVQKRWLSLGLGWIAVSTVSTAMVIGPWVAVFVLFRKQSRLSR
jgi:hypothetical protein